MKCAHEVLRSCHDAAICIPDIIKLSQIDISFFFFNYVSSIDCETA